MIEGFELTKLLEKYGLNIENILNNNDNILTYGEYKDIDVTLDYLINELKINKIYIEKCPSILYRSVREIKDNVKFLKEKDIKFSNVESCLHVLSTNSNQLVDTYNYVEKYYGIESINKVTSVLAVPIEKIVGIENLNIPNIKKNDIISISVGRNSVDDIKRIINSKEFKEYPELFTSTTLAYSNIEDIRLLLDLPYWQEEKYKKLLTCSIVAKSKVMIEKLPILFKMAEEYDIDEYLTTNYLLHSPSQNYALINYLIDNEMPLIIFNAKKEGKLNPIFNKAPGVLKNKYNIDIKELMIKYPYNEDIKIK